MTHFEDESAPDLMCRPTSHITLYYGDNCAPCRALKPELRDLAMDMGIPLIEKDIKEHMAEAKELGIRGVPTVVADDTILFTGNLARGAIIAKLHASGVV